MTYNKYILIAVFTLLITSCHAQKIKNEKTETVHIYGNCGMCEQTIENAGNKRKEAKVDWDKETKMATISYDSSQTTKNEILQRIALAGYDNELFRAPDDTYNSLHGCCQYERAIEKSVEENPQADMPMEPHQSSNMNIDSTIEKTSPTESVNNQNANLNSVFTTYFSLKDALVSSDPKLASASAKKMLTEINAVPMAELDHNLHMEWMKQLKGIKENAEHIANSKDIENQRKHFMALSQEIYTLMKIADYSQPVYYQHCPMANEGKGANWLSEEKEVKNPYYGSAMLSCGKTIETIK